MKLVLSYILLSYLSIIFLYLLVDLMEDQTFSFTKKSYNRKTKQYGLCRFKNLNVLIKSSYGKPYPILSII